MVHDNGLGVSHPMCTRFEITGWLVDVMAGQLVYGLAFPPGR